MIRNSGDLNTIYGGEQAAVEIYNRFIKDIKDLDLKQSMTRAMQDHLKHLQDIEVYMSFVGVKPINTVPLAGAFANMRLMVENIFKEDSEILKAAAQEERIGADAYKKIYNELKDKEAKELIGKIISNDLNIADKFESMAAKYKN